MLRVLLLVLLVLLLVLPLVLRLTGWLVVVPCAVAHPGRYRNNQRFRK